MAMITAAARKNERAIAAAVAALVAAFGNRVVTSQAVREQHGHTTTWHANQPPDAVVCDMLLPDISGVDVYQRAIAADPSYRQRFAVATGASNIPFVAAFLASFSGPVLYKPVDAAQLSIAVRTCLNGARMFLKSGARV